ncbi:MAG: GxxExxY protein [Candidatus Cloacimonetes bacterium]|nr:GxxExxY protein [Candidatus Cloacimonadota bacterium]
MAVYKSYVNGREHRENSAQELLHKDLTDMIISCFFKVYNKLGYGFLEKVYENSMLHELRIQRLNVASQFPVSVFYDNVRVGEYFADLIVENKVIIELKASSTLVNDHVLQLQNYLRATNIEVGLLLNFGLKPEIRRKSFLNSDKGTISQYNPDNPVNPVHP